MKKSELTTKKNTSPEDVSTVNVENKDKYLTIYSDITIKTKKKTISRQEYEKFINAVASNYGLSTTQTITIIAIIYQLGGINVSRKTNIKRSFTLDNNTIDVESKRINSILRMSLNNKATPRQVAKYMANVIFEAAKLYKIHGNCHAYFTRNYYEEYKKITNPDKCFWASDFQSDNENCDPQIKRLLNKRYEDNFRNKRQKK